ncbi:uncharacterized protein BO97DRAFT_423506 [Aspergillus homomorphus CBS 101889]|uniref:Uncharacterized protein n=1 Tax=Aspergillus homomorphus (strain CBS 101889) TaxID=1450537 RepID=A0A395I1C3_ASPHC|nr:hypothetical protein BO97DRAFT_423506 [Aspergillus homomorphus CBS 101889]RAL13727.1 hypothetical protein BO97DRAFT_423506 [Aspergillus homomorphus CBS 101889]
MPPSTKSDTDRGLFEKRNPEGCNAALIYSKCEETPPSERPMRTTNLGMEKWFGDTFGVDLGPHPGRIMSIMRHEAFRKIVLWYCQTQYGEKVLGWNLMKSIVTLKLDSERSLPLIFADKGA